MLDYDTYNRFQAKPIRRDLMWEAAPCRIPMVNRHMSFNTSLRATFVITNRVVGAVCIVILPLVLTQHLLTCQWCDHVFFLDNVPIFDVLLKHDQITINDLCLLELACGLALFFRVSYLGFAHQAIIDEHVSRMRSLGREPRRSFTKAVMIGGAMSLLAIAESFTGSWDFIRSYGASKATFIAMCLTFALFYVTPELLIYVWYIAMNKLDTR